MTENICDGKIYRILEMYETFNKGEKRSKKFLANRFGVNDKTIQRDIQELREYLKGDEKNKRDIIYNRKIKKYEMVNNAGYKFSDRDIYVLSKIILESRAFSENEMDKILNILNAQSENNEVLAKIIKNERFNYVPPIHNKNIIDYICSISLSIENHNLVEMSYVRQDSEKREYILKPLGLIFKEFYFYLIGEIVGINKGYKTVFRVDRINSYNITQEKFTIPYRDRFEEGEFNKRIQFMYTGELLKIQFKFWGDSLEAILDRLPTAKVIYYDKKDNKPILEAEVYGEGVKRWILSQKEFLEVLRPESYRNEIKETIKKMYNIYY